VTWLLLLVLTVALSGCGDTDDTDTGANPSPADGQPTATRAAAAYLTPEAEVQPVRFPEDEAPHDVLTEWWYYTGHLFTEDGTRYGFEYVFFHAQRGAFEPYFAAHFAVTDSANDRFVYDERFGPNASQPTDAGFNLTLDDWSMRGALGIDVLNATMDEPDGFAIDLTLTDEKGPILHNDIGYVEFGPAGGSYYYSRTSIAVEGSLTVDGVPQPVTGEAWFDHQWGNFIQVGAGGWDWFAVQLENDEELTISLVRAEDGSVVMSYGTHVAADGTATHLEMGDLEVTSTETWTSERTGATWPSRWTIEVPEIGWTVDLVPSVADQELDTTESTGVIYWEGEVLVTGQVDEQSVEGLGYVELTGYANGDTSREAP
jgi:predicted secreted hydrolase